MAKVDLILPKMGESIIEATILKWTKNIGDNIEEDETILEIATDKVDSEVPSPFSGTLVEILFQEDDVVQIGSVIARIETEGEIAQNIDIKTEVAVAKVAKVQTPQASTQAVEIKSSISGDRFYSPLVKSIASKEGVNQQELDGISGSGKDGRVTKNDILSYLKTRSNGTVAVQSTISPSPKLKSTPVAVSSSGATEIVEMDRMRKLIAHHMVKSWTTSPHVTSMVEVDVTNLVNWRNSVKNEFLKKHGEKITFTPIFFWAVAKAILDFPDVNVSIDGDNIIKKKDINLGMAAALPSGNLIVPVIHNADQLNLIGLAKAVNSLANKARNNKLKPTDIQNGTFTVTNVGTFGNVMGTPIINQPQVAILATGAIRKKPAVVETPQGDFIAIRQMMFLSLSYDHRVVDGALGGSLVRRIADYLEQFDVNQTI